LLEKLKATRIADLALSLLASYLDGRKQFVKINGVNSEAWPIVMGISQGSVLGATLFLIFIHDIFNLRLHGKIQLYTYDSVLMYTAGDFATIIEHMQEDAFCLGDLFSRNNIRMNVAKTNYILFRNFRDDVSSLRVNGTAIEEVWYVKYLCLVIDNALKLENHVSCIRKRFLPLLFEILTEAELKSNNFNCYSLFAEFAKFFYFFYPKN
jgi:hypothetical protein